MSSYLIIAILLTFISYQMNCSSELHEILLRDNNYYPIDHNLYYITIPITTQEWSKFMSELSKNKSRHHAETNDNLKHNNPQPSVTNNNDMFDGYGPIHMWIKCIDYNVRVYYFMENLMRGIEHLSTENFSILKGILSFKVNGEDVIRHKITSGGGDFRKDLNKMNNFHKMNVLQITINDWIHYGIFPISECKQSYNHSYFKNNRHKLTNSSTNINNDLGYHDNNNIKNKVSYIISAYTWDEYDETSTHASLDKLEMKAKAFARHAYYHICLLNITRYEAIIDLRDLSYFQNHIILQDLINQKLLYFVTKGNHPSPLRGNTPKWQGITQNLALLRYWNNNHNSQNPSIRLLFIDPDEFIIMNNHTKLTEVNSVAARYGVITLIRHDLVCTDCYNNNNDNNNNNNEMNTIFSHHFYYQINHFVAPKVIIDPHRAGCMYVHWSKCATKGTKYDMKENKLFLAHFANYYFQRHSIELIKSQSNLTSIYTTKQCDPLLNNHNISSSTFHGINYNYKHNKNSNYNNSYSQFYFENKSLFSRFWNKLFVFYEVWNKRFI
eukprot:gene10472-14072_t